MTDALDGKPAEPGPMDLIEIYYAPTDVFARRAEGGEFALPLIALPIALTVLYYATRNAMQPVFDAEWARMMPGMMAKMPNVPPERLQAMKEMGAKWGGLGMFFGAGLVAPFVAGIVVWLVSRAVGLATGFAFINMCGNLAGLVIPGFIGWVRQRTGSFDAPIYVMATLLMIAALLLIPIAKADRRRNAAVMAAA